MVMIAYNEAIDTEVMEILDTCGMLSYTKTVATYGRGKSSGTHLGNDIWPGRNNILYVACEDEEVKKLISAIKHLRASLSKEGIKAFVLPIEDLT